MLVGLAEYERTSRLYAGALLTFLGDASYSIYLIHIPVLSLLVKFAVASSLNKMMNPQLAFFALALLSVFAGCCMHMLIERPLLRWIRRTLMRSKPDAARTR